MTSFLEVDAANESLTRTASRKTVIAAKARVDERFGDFLRQAATAEEFDQRLALVHEDLEAVVKEAASEYEGNSSLEQYIKTIVDSIRPAEPKTASVHESRKVKMCPFHKDVVDISLAAEDARAGFDSMAQHWGGPRHCEGEGYEGSKCNFKPQMVTQSWWDERAEKAEQRRQERAEQAAELEAQQGDEIIDQGDEITEPVADGDTIIEEPVAEDNVVDVDFGGTEEAPVAEATEEIPMSMAASTKEANQYIKKQGDQWVILQKDTGKVLSHHDSEEEAEESFRAMMANKHGSVKQADGGPVPVMDKRKWTPQTVPFLDDVDDPNGPNPSKHKDIVEPIKPANADKLTEIGEQVTERQDVGKEVDYAKTDGQSATWSEGPKTAVSSLPNDAHTNPIVELVKGNYDGFLPAHTVQQALAAHRGE